MWVVVKIGSKQYKVKQGDTIEVQRLKDIAVGKVTLGQVMLYSDSKSCQVGKPYLKDVKLEVEVLGESKAKKVIVYKYKRRKDYKKKTGHRQIRTSVKILKIKTK